MSLNEMMKFLHQTGGNMADININQTSTSTESKTYNWDSPYFAQ